MEQTDPALSHEGAATGALPSRTVEPSTNPTAPLASEKRDLYDEQAARPPVMTAHDETTSPSAAGSSGVGALAGAGAGVGAGAGAGAGAAAAASQSTSRSGRKTKHGYTTSADLGPNYGKTKFGYTTGADGKHGPQDGSTAGAVGGTAAAAAGVGAGAAGAEAAHHSSTHEKTDSPAETHASTKKQDDEPTNYEGGAAGEASKDDSTQHASQGEDPNLVETKGKWQGTGEPGSHSAVFGLTPDGKTYDETGKHGSETTKLETTPAEQDDKNAVGGGSVGQEDTGSREGTRAEVAEQMHDPRVAEKGHDGKAEYHGGTGKPGSGA